MAHILERLVAKGRRVQNIRDQREVAFGLADISTHHELHQRMVQKGGIKTLLHLLTSSRDVDAQRFAVLAIANTSCAENYRVEIAQQDTCIETLVNYIQNDEIDLTVRQYCTMALGNLAADVENHEGIASFGGIEASVSILKSGAKNQELESGRYASLALSNLAVDSELRKRIVQCGAIESLVLIACGDDVGIQRQALAALRAICITAEYRAQVIGAGILDPLVILSRSGETQIIQEVSAALNCLSSVAECKQEVCSRAMLTIISFLLSGDEIIERHACCAIANLVEEKEIHQKLLEENGLPPIVAMFSSQDLHSKGEAARALANLSANENVQSYLVDTEILQVVVKALYHEEVNCQRFAALFLANLGTVVASQVKIVQEGALQPLIQLVGNECAQIEARRYAALALANLSATIINHEIIVQEGGLEALFTLSNSPDILAQYYVACTLANLASNIKVHERVVNEGGIQPLIDLAYSRDPDVHLHASAALRGLSVTGDFKVKIVQEGGLEPLLRLLLSKDIDLLRQVTACLCNLSLGDENKVELGNSGLITPLITLMQHEDKDISSHSCACLANLAEISYNQEIIVAEGGIQPCVVMVRSKFLEVQREAGRLLANLCACDAEIASQTIIENGGHNVLISFLLSRDVACQRVGTFGIGNLCTHARHRETLVMARVLAPLSTLVRDVHVNIEIRRFAILAIVNLSNEVKNHSAFVKDRVLNVIISLANSEKEVLRQYAALAVANIAKNMDFRKEVTEEGGLDSVLYLARMSSNAVRKEVLGAISTLSFVEENRFPLCTNGGLHPIIQELQDESGSYQVSRLASCAVANLSERIGNMSRIVDAGIIHLLVKNLRQKELEENDETLRALGNLATNLDYSTLIMKERDLIDVILSTLQHGGMNSKRMAAMLLSNLAANVQFHDSIMKTDIVDVIVRGFEISLDPKRKSDHEYTRFCLLLVSNLCTKKDNHEIFLSQTFGLLLEFAKHRDIKCRHNAIIALGNLCSNRDNLEKFQGSDILNTMISFAFPPVKTEPTNAQYQAIAGIRGLSIRDQYRTLLVRKGCCEPLALAAGDECIEGMDIEVQREAAAALFNLALSEENSLEMAQSGIVRALISLFKVKDSVAQVFAVGTLSNLVEKTFEVQSRLLQDGFLQPMVKMVTTLNPSKETCREVSRCLALLANEPKSHSWLLHESVLQCIFVLIQQQDNHDCNKFAVLALANLALESTSHAQLAKVDILQKFQPLLLLKKKEINQCIAFALHNICKNSSTHDTCIKGKVPAILCQLLQFDDTFVQVHGCLALRYLSNSQEASAKFVENKGLPILFSISQKSDMELKLEVAACLKNISLSDVNKVYILKQHGLPIVTDLTRSENNTLAHNACGIIANLAEIPSKRKEMITDGILHHIKFTLRSNYVEVQRESLRALSNLSSDFECIISITESGLLSPLVKSLSSPNSLCKRFSAMAISNLATNRKIHSRLVEECAIDPLIYIVSQDKLEDKDALKFAYIALVNLSSSEFYHDLLIACDITRYSLNFAKSHDTDLKQSATLCLANLVSNRTAHSVLHEAGALPLLERMLENSDRFLHLCAASFLRGASTSGKMRPSIMRPEMLRILLRLAKSEDVELQREIIATLCNLSLTGLLGEKPNAFLDSLGLQTLLSFLCSADSIYRLFGAVVIGNIASDSSLHSEIFNSGTMSPLIHTTKIADKESKRCIAYTLCNLCLDNHYRNKIVLEGGLLPILTLMDSTSTEDRISSISTVRALSSKPELRQFIVESGALDYVLGMCRDDDNLFCIEEACEALSWLSLNDENKICILSHPQIQNLFDLLDSMTIKEGVTIQALRVLSNCSESQLCHPKILSHLKAQTFEALCYMESVSIQKEMSRFMANLFSNHDNHETLFDMRFMKHIFLLSKSKEPVLQKNAMLMTMNLSTNDKNHQEISNFKQEILEFIGKSLETNGTCSILTKKLLCYSCSAVGNLFRNRDVCPLLMNNDILGKLLSLMKRKDEELRFLITYVLHQALKNSQETDLPVWNNSIPVLLKFIESNVSNNAVHALCTLRYLSECHDKAQVIIKGNGLAVLEAYLEQGNDEIEREVIAILCHLSSFKDIQTTVSQLTLLSKLRKLCEKKDCEISRFALGTVANCMETYDNQELLLASSPDMISILIKLVKSKFLSTKREASRAISNLLSSDEFAKLFLNYGGLDAISSAHRITDYELQYSLSLSLRKLSSRRLSHAEIISSKGLSSLLYFCQLSHNRDAVRHSALGLQNLSSNAEFRIVLANEGALNVVSKLLTSNDLITSIASAQTLEYLSIPRKLKFIIFENGMGDTICEQINRTKDGEFLLHAAGILANLSTQKDIRKQMWKQQIVGALVILSKEQDNNIDYQVSKCICFMSTSLEQDCEDKSILARTIMSVAIQMVSSRNTHVADNAVTSIGNFAKERKHQLHLAQINGFDPIVDLVKEIKENPSSSLNSCWALGRLLLSKENRYLSQKGKCIFAYLNDICLARSQDDDCSHVSAMICNAAASKSCHDLIQKSGIVSNLVETLQSTSIKTVLSSLKALCNLCTTEAIRDEIVDANGLKVLLRLIHRYENCVREHAILLLANLTISLENCKKVAALGILTKLYEILDQSTNSNINEASATIMYNISREISCHEHLIHIPVLKCLLALCENEDSSCREFAMRTLCNLAANDKYRTTVREAGCIKRAILMLNDSCCECKVFASICLANLAIEKTTQSQIVLQGALTALEQQLTFTNYAGCRSTILCLTNIAANSSNHSAFLSHNLLQKLSDLWNNWKQSDINTYIACCIVNLLANRDLLDIIGNHNALSVLKQLSLSSSLNCQCAAMAAIRRLTETESNKIQFMIDKSLIDVMNSNGKIDNSDMTNEIAGCLRNLCQNEEYRQTIADMCIETLKYFLSSNDFNTLENTMATLAYLAESHHCIAFIIENISMSRFVRLFEVKALPVIRETSRAISNLLSCSKVHTDFSLNGLQDFLNTCYRYTDEELFYSVSLACRKIVISTESHATLVKSLDIMSQLLKSRNLDTIKQCLTTLRDLSYHDENKQILATHETTTILIKFLEHHDLEVKTITTATLSHLASNYAQKKVIMKNDIIAKAVSSILNASPELLLHLSGLIMNLSEEDSNSFSMVKMGVVPALTVLSRALDKRILDNVARTFANLSGRIEVHLDIQQQGGLICLLNLASLAETSVCKIYIPMAIQFLLSNSQVRKIVMKEKGLSQISSLLNQSSTEYKLGAIRSLKLFSLDENHRVHVAKIVFYNIEKLSSVTELAFQRELICTVANLADSLDTHDLLIENNFVEIIAKPMLHSNDMDVIRDLARFCSSISLNMKARSQILSSKILSKIIKFCRRPDKEIQRYSSLTLCNLTLLGMEKQVIAKEEGVLGVLLFLAQCSDVEVERCSLLSIAALSFGTKHDCKLLVENAGLLTTILNSISCPDYKTKQCASLALNGLLLDVDHHVKRKLCNRREDLKRLLSQLEVPDDECRYNVVFALGSLIEDKQTRSLLRELGFVSSIVNIFPKASVDTKRGIGYILAILSEEKETHADLLDSGAIQCVVDLAALVDIEGQLFGVFCLVFLSSDPQIQVEVVEKGVVKSLVSMMAIRSNLRFFAGLALLKLAENHLTHLRIAEDGGLDALLKLGKNSELHSEIKYASNIVVSKLSLNLSSGKEESSW